MVGFSLENRVLSVSQVKYIELRTFGVKSSGRTVDALRHLQLLAVVATGLGLLLKWLAQGRPAALSLWEGTSYFIGSG